VSEPLELIVSVCVVVAVRVEVLDAVTGLFDGLVVGDLLRLGVREGEAAFDGVTVASLVGDTLLEIVRVSDRVILGDFDSERVILGDFDSDGVIEIVVLGRLFPFSCLGLSAKCSWLALVKAQMSARLC